MGGQNSKVSGEDAYQLIADARPYLDDSFVDCATTIINDFAVGGKDNISLKFKSLAKFLLFTVDVTQRTAESIKILKNLKIRKINIDDVEAEFLKCSGATLDFLGELEVALRDSRSNQSKLINALDKSLQDVKDGNRDGVLPSTLEALESFQKAENPFDDYFKIRFEKTMNCHKKMSETLKDRIKKLDKELTKSKVIRNVLCGLFAVTTIGLLALAIVSFFPISIPVLATPALALMSTVVATPTAHIGILTYGRFKASEKESKKKIEILRSMNVENATSVEKLVDIQALVNSFACKLKEMKKKGRDFDLAKLFQETKDLKDMASELNKTYTFLCEQIDDCRIGLIKARNKKNEGSSSSSQ